MANLESKLLDGKNVGYCSSSEGEEETGWKVANDDDEHQSRVMRQMGGGGGNTGPKGVLNDYHEHRARSKREREARDREVLRVAQRGMLQGNREDRERMAEEADESEGEDSLESLRARRIRELRKAASGKMVEITEKDQYLKAIESCGSALLCVLIYEPGTEQCDRMSHVCKVLAADYPRVKFIRARSSILGMSKAFEQQGLPSLQFYLNGILIGNFIQMTSLLGMDYDARKVRSFLRKNCISLDRGCQTTDSEYSTDEDLD